MKNKKIKKKKSDSALKEYASNIPEEIKPFLKVHAKLLQANLTASDIRYRLKITQRQLNYLEGILYPKEPDEKSKWHRYSIIDLLSMMVFKTTADYDLPRETVAVLFAWIKDLLSLDRTLLVNVSKGKEVVIFFDYSNIMTITTPHIFTLPEEKNKYLKKVTETESPFIVIHLDSILRDGLKKIATHDFSTDVDEKSNKIIYKIDGEKIRLDDIPDDLYKELNKVNNLTFSNDKK